MRGRDALPGQTAGDDLRDATLCLMNAERTARGLRSLQVEPLLGRVATGYARQMVRLATPRAMVRAWMHSPDHRANLLDRRFADVGIGVAVGAPIALRPGALGGAYVTDFGRRQRG